MLDFLAKYVYNIIVRTYRNLQHIKTFTIMKQLEVFNYRGYGDYGCSKCKSPLVGRFTAIGEVSDEDGYEWRIFLP